MLSHPTSHKATRSRQSSDIMLTEAVVIALPHNLTSVILLLTFRNIQDITILRHAYWMNSGQSNQGLNEKHLLLNGVLHSVPRIPSTPLTSIGICRYHKILHILFFRTSLKISLHQHLLCSTQMVKTILHSSSLSITFLMVGLAFNIQSNTSKAISFLILVV